MTERFAKGRQLAQLRPDNTLYNTLIAGGGQDGPRIEITRIHVVNTNSTSTFWRLCHDVDGTTFDESTAIYWDIPIAGDTTEVIDAQHPGGGIALGKSGALGLLIGLANAITVTVYGVVEASQETAGDVR